MRLYINTTRSLRLSYLQAAKRNYTLLASISSIQERIIITISDLNDASDYKSVRYFSFVLHRRRYKLFWKVGQIFNQKEDASERF